MLYAHRGRRTIYGLLGALPMMLAAVWWMSRTPLPGAEGGRGPLTARGLYAQAVGESERGDRTNTVRHLRMALAILEGPGVTPNDRAMEFRVRASLARLLLAQGARDEAVTVCAPACRMTSDGAPALELVNLGLCAP
ncbi:MAG: hypothetical protein U0325_29205 [Polyangiales bacterium]